MHTLDGGLRFTCSTECPIKLACQRFGLERSVDLEIREKKVSTQFLAELDDQAVATMLRAANPETPDYEIEYTQKRLESLRPKLRAEMELLEQGREQQTGRKAAQAAVKNSVSGYRPKGCVSGPVLTAQPEKAKPGESTYSVSCGNPPAVAAYDTLLNQYAPSERQSYDSEELYFISNLLM